MASRRQRLEMAGAWLRVKRQRAGMSSARAFAEALDLDPSRVSRYETGSDAVPDEIAERIAKVLRIPILDVRRGLGFWVPDDSDQHQVSDPLPEDEEWPTDPQERKLWAMTDLPESTRSGLIAVLRAQRQMEQEQNQHRPGAEAG